MFNILSHHEKQIKMTLRLELTLLTLVSMVTIREKKKTLTV